jgi:hypothetical protein
VVLIRYCIPAEMFIPEAWRPLDLPNDDAFVFYPDIEKAGDPSPAFLIYPSHLIFSCFLGRHRP